MARLPAAWSARDADGRPPSSLGADEEADSDAAMNEAIDSGGRQAVWFLDDPPF